MKIYNYQSYCPTQKEIEGIKENLRANKIAALIASIVFGSMVLYTIFAFLKNESFSIVFSIIVFILLGFFVGLAVWLAKDAWDKCNLNLDEVQFTSGYILNTWSETIGTGKNRSRNYYAKIELNNDLVLERVLISSALYGYANNNVVIAIKDNEILCIVLKEV